VSEQATRPRQATASRHDELRAALIDEAERVIAREGLAALRARALADAAGCSVGAIYTVFPDLHALILAVNGRTLAAIDHAMAQAAAPADPIEHLVRLARAYLEYAAGAKLRWLALFQHVTPPDRPLSEWYLRQQEAAFSHIEAPIGRLCPDLPGDERALLARTLFSAVHGMVALGLDETVAALPLPMLHAQIATIVAATARGLVALAGGPAGGPAGDPVE
jgi:AcrR family transcriptional regulator